MSAKRFSSEVKDVADSLLPHLGTYEITIPCIAFLYRFSRFQKTISSGDWTRMIYLLPAVDCIS